MGRRLGGWCTSECYTSGLSSHEVCGRIRGGGEVEVHAGRGKDGHEWKVDVRCLGDHDSSYQWMTQLKCSPPWQSPYVTRFLFPKASISPQQLT